jgi:hypothetical protein
MAETGSKTLEKCRICGSAQLWRYLDLGTTPLANAYLLADQLDQPEFREELAIQHCPACGLSQLTKVVNPPRMFQHYLFVSGTTRTFQDHCVELAGTAIKTAEAASGDWVLDIASNDGCLLSKFRDRGMRIVGVDPAENLAEEANRAGITTVCAYWSARVADQIRAEYGPPKIITATNVFAHVDDVHGFADAVGRCLAPKGIWIIEAPYVLDFIERNLFDTAYHEHLSYLGVHPLVTLMAGHGMSVFDVQYFSEIHGGTIRVFIARTGDHEERPAVQTFLDKEIAFGIKDAEPYAAFARRVESNKQNMLELLPRLNAESRVIWAYGASAKGNTLMNYLGITREQVPVVIDDNPKKHGWYTPGGHLRITGIDELRGSPADHLLLLAWNYEAEIRRRAREVGYAGRFIIPVPEVKVV